ncbi:hypothetical protein GWI33_015183 [Rhynchophorus ferrugineus]|uniref:Uncharacterized protein n=1 Tax=Rhynchophorus ferrugineus TaxID=354439 RepID=A0A834HZW7_RHYFE|nr:hypothetical protein GWI33_015183 [Rhynchophorus ferrugineus]
MLSQPPSTFLTLRRITTHSISAPSAKGRHQKFPKTKPFPVPGQNSWISRRARVRSPAVTYQRKQNALSTILPTTLNHRHGEMERPARTDSCRRIRDKYIGSRPRSGALSARTTFPLNEGRARSEKNGFAESLRDFLPAGKPARDMVGDFSTRVVEN